MSVGLGKSIDWVDDFGSTTTLIGCTGHNLHLHAQHYFNRQCLEIPRCRSKKWWGSLPHSLHRGTSTYWETFVLFGYFCTMNTVTIYTI